MVSLVVTSAWGFVLDFQSVSHPCNFIVSMVAQNLRIPRITWNFVMETCKTHVSRWQSVAVPALYQRASAVQLD